MNLQIEQSEVFARELARSLVAEMTTAQRVELCRELMDEGIRRELVRELSLISAEEGGVMVRWTEAGFRRVATRENCPAIKLGHKQPELFQLRDVASMFERLKLWPKGKPVELKEVA